MVTCDTLHEAKMNGPWLDKAEASFLVAEDEIEIAFGVKALLWLSGIPPGFIVAKVF